LSELSEHEREILDRAFEEHVLRPKRNSKPRPDDDEPDEQEED
jgi:hypothetical protein